MVARSFIAHGRVQGVFFRESLRRAAVERGVAGWARNEADGTVRGALEGQADAVATLLDVIRDGPGAASVDRLEIAEIDPAELDGFRTG